MDSDISSRRSRAAFEAKHNDVKKVLRDLHVEVEMFRITADDAHVWDRAATLAEVEQILRTALRALREDATDAPPR